MNKTQPLDHDPVNNPSHYTSHPSGVECITITEHMSFNVGNAIKYLWRAAQKGAQLQDLEKAGWYVDREIKRLAPKEVKKCEVENGQPEPPPKRKRIMSWLNGGTMFAVCCDCGVVPEFYQQSYQDLIGDRLMCPNCRSTL